MAEIPMQRAATKRRRATREDRPDMQNHANWFDASLIPWISYDSLNMERPDGHLFFNPIVNGGTYACVNSAYKMPVSVRFNHAITDGYLVAKVFTLIEKEMDLPVK